MALEVDASQRFRNDDRRRALVRAVLAADPEDEARWVEWKRSLDLSSKEHKLKVAQAILAFANRLPDQAEQWAEGYAYLLVGVEPGDLVGMERLDVADIEEKVRAWVGGGDRAPRWNASWVDESGRSVLVIEVEPPEPGDPLFPLRMQYAQTAAGTVFVRRQAASPPADDQEILQLSERAAGQRRMTLDIERGDEDDWLAVVPKAQDLDRVLDTLREEAMAPLQEAQAKRRREHEARRREAATKNPVFGSLGVDISQIIGANLVPAGARLGGYGENRSEEDYEVEVDAYIRECQNLLSDVVIAQVIEGELLTINLRASNSTEHHLAAVSIVASISGQIHVWDELRPDSLPPRPRAYGQVSPAVDIPHHYPSLVRAGTYPNQPEVTQTSDGIEVRWQPTEISPLDSVRLPEVPIAIFAKSRGTDVMIINWRASSPGARGVATGTIPVPVRAATPTADMLLNLLRGD